MIQRIQDNSHRLFSESPQNARQLTTVLAWLLVVLTLGRIAMVIFPSPIVGYANNYDFIRSSACTGLWQLDADGSMQNFPGVVQTVNRLKRTGVELPSSCIHSVDNFFPWLAAKLHQKGDAVDIRWVGGVRLLALSVAITLLMCLVRSAGLRLALAGVFALLWGDLVIVPYFNTFYLEFSVIGGAFFTIASLVWLHASSDPLRRGTVLFVMAALLWLGLSKQQYAGLACIFAFYAAFLLMVRHRSWGAAGTLALLGCFILSSMQWLNDSEREVTRSIAMANNTNTFFQAVLPFAQDRSLALETLGVPARCEPAISQNWLSPGYQQSQPCPEIAHISRARLPLLFWSQPATFLMPMEIGLMSVSPFRPVELPGYEGDLQSPGLLLTAVRETSLTTVVAHWNDATRWVHALLAVACGVVFSLLSLWNAFRRTPIGAWVWGCAMLGLGGMLMTYAVASSVFGDGFMDIQKHTVGYTVGMCFQAIGILLLCGAFLRHFLRGKALLPSRSAAAVGPHAFNRGIRLKMRARFFRFSFAVSIWGGMGRC